VNLLNGDVTKWFPDGRAPMSLRFFVLFCWLSLSSPSVAQQEPIDVPFDDAALTASPITATGKVSVRETVAANEVKSSWEWNVDATNISTKSVLLLIGELDAIGPHSNGGTQLTMEYFFGEPISPGETFSLYKRSSVHDSCCINPLRETHEPKATFRLIFVQFLDGSTFGDAVQAENALANRDRGSPSVKNSGSGRGEGQAEIPVAIGAAVAARRHAWGIRCHSRDSRTKRSGCGNRTNVQDS
jgi:hypothetical protein